ncbi:uroporphyrinogen decarboxylase family protein [uncultured Flavonifractor sp.]|uniref:uroporphyrinogen decarboxylase family protein n=1 Tax=uncultured Flavonifractor sp. TaxID=1193534 RepID=UPI0017481595|nr:uroporphyrinogen decarboxylase family protein [uncultured Flavonifractor sp.]
MTEMTSLQRVQAVLAGQMPDRLPVIPQGFLFSAKTAGYDIGEINRSPAKMAESHLLCLEKYGYDGCVVDVDDATLAEACGARVVFREHDVASVDEHHPVLTDLRDIDSLQLPDPLKDGRICDWLETTQRLVEAVGDRVFVMGRADQGPFSLLCLLRGTQELMMDLLTEDEEVVCHALEWTTQAHIRFAQAQLQAGAHATSMGDAYASSDLISPDMYRTFAHPYEKKVVEALAPTGKPYSVHICGDTSAIVGDMGALGAQILELDWKVDMGTARQAVPDSTVLMGNINPSDPMCIGTPEQVRSCVQDVIHKTRGRGLILSSGCALGANTKPENMAALVESARLYGTREQLEELQK